MKTCMHVMVVEYANEYYLHRMAQDGTGRWSSLTQIHRISPKDPILRLSSSWGWPNFHILQDDYTLKHTAV